MTSRWMSVVVLAGILAACGGGGADVEDGATDTFLGEDGKDDVYGVEDGTREADAVLRVANELSAADLDDDVGLTTRVADGIVAARPLATLAALDDVPYLGRRAFARLLDYARDHGYVDDGGGADAAPGSDADEGAAGDVCARQHAGTTSDGEAVTVCDELHRERPFVRLPADTRDGDRLTIHGALVLSGNYEVHDRTGKIYMVVDASGGATEAADIPGARMPSYRFWYLTYRITGTETVWVSPYNGERKPAITIDAVTPEVLIAGDALDGQMLGTWEGTMTPRTGEGSWELGGEVPVRVTFDRLTPRANVPVLDPNGAKLDDGVAFDIVGTVDNRTAAVRAADGTCLPSFTSRGAADPLYGATSSVLKLWRLGSMHALGDSQLAIEYPDGTRLGVGMGDIAPVAAQGLIRTVDDDAWAAGSHNSWQFQVALHRVSGGGDTCAD